VTAPGPDREHPADAPDVSERTYLAWQRTGLSFAALGALLLHAAGGMHHPLASLPGIAGLVAGGVILLRALVRYPRLAAAARARRRAAPPVPLAGVAVLVVALGLAALALLISVASQG
jgi:uncharacterized membrane protein YidH (DUF202 family)